MSNDKELTRLKELLQEINNVLEADYAFQSGLYETISKTDRHITAFKFSDLLEIIRDFTATYNQQHGISHKPA
jgi:hypothetical protein